MVLNLRTVCLTLKDVEFSGIVEEEGATWTTAPRRAGHHTVTMTTDTPAMEAKIRHILDRATENARNEWDENSGGGEFYARAGSHGNVDHDACHDDINNHEVPSDNKQRGVQFKDEDPFSKPSKVTIGHSLDRLGQTIPNIGGKLGVDHQHYEQWARNPVRKSTQNSVLLRGIQQLKARVHDRSIVDDPIPDLAGSLDMNLKITATEKDKSYMPKLGQSWTFRREKTSSSIPSSDIGSIKSHPGVRKPLKPNPQLIDAESCFDDEDASQARDRRYTGFAARDLAIPRCGFSKTRDRHPLHVSVSQPKCLGDHVFLINEPGKYPVLTRERSKIDIGPVKVAVHPEHPEIRITVPEVNDPNDPFPVPYRCQRSNTYIGTCTQKRLPQLRIPVNVSNAELIDFSQLADPHRAFDDEYMKYLERGKTSYSSRRPKFSAGTSVMVRGPRFSGRIPRINPQRMVLK